MVAWAVLSSRVTQHNEIGVYNFWCLLRTGRVCKISEVRVEGKRVIKWHQGREGLHANKKSIAFNLSRF